MSTHLPPKKNDANGFVTYVSLTSQANTLIFQANPTLAAGDILVCVDDAAPGNISAFAVDADHTKRVKLTLSQAQTNGDVITIMCSDVAGAEWCDLLLTIHTTGQTLDEVDALIDTILVDTNSLNDVAIAELAQAAPTATPTVRAALMYLYMIARNKLTTTGTELGIYNNAGTKIVKRTLADDGATFTESEAESGA